MLNELKLDKDFWACIEVMQYMDGGDTWILGPVWRWTYILIPWCVSDGTWRDRYQNLFWGGTWHGLQWDANLVTRMEVIHSMGLGTWIQLGWDLGGIGTYIFRPVWISNGIWMELISLSLSLSSPGWRWDAIIWTWVEVTCDLDGV